jgi:VRR-NUC domain
MIRRVSEAAFQQQVVQLAGFYGWNLVYHTHDSRRSNKGWPDLVICRAPEIVFVELKGDKTRVRPEQKAWLAALAACGLEAYLWRPNDFDDLHARLARGRQLVQPLYGSEAA